MALVDELERPQVIISNTLETNSEFLSRASSEDERDRLFRLFQVAGERTLLWGRDRKLVFTDRSVAHVEYTCNRLGYHQTEFLAPTEPTASLCHDILREPALLNRLIEYAGPTRSVEILPFATTPPLLELVQVLRQQGVTVHLPESPTPEALWLKDYVQTKVGFRSLVGQWLGATVLPEGWLARSLEEAAAIAFSFCARQQRCIVKPNTGCLGIGHTILQPHDFSNAAEILHKLQYNPFLKDDLLVVEEYVASSQQISPSIELLVPPMGLGYPMVTHLCNQLLRNTGSYIGELVSREWLATSWGKALVEYGLKLAEKLQAMGYCGRFDLDAIVGDNEQVALLEINSRRTGGTHVHELGQFLFGKDYLDKVVLLSQTSADSGYITETKELFTALKDLLFPISGPDQTHAYGLVITHTGALHSRRFGYIILAPTTAEALTLQQKMQVCLRSPHLQAL